MTSSPRFIMFFSTLNYDDRQALSKLLDKTYPEKYQKVDSCYARVAYEMDNFPDFVQDVKQCAETLNVQLKQLMVFLEPGLGLLLDFVRDDFDDKLHALGCGLCWSNTPHPLIPSSYCNYA